MPLFLFHRRQIQTTHIAVTQSHCSLMHIYIYIYISIYFQLLINLSGILYVKVFSHDDVIKWKHFPRYWPFVRGIHRSPVDSPHKGHWCGVLMFSLICAWTNGWVNNRDAGDLRRHCAHYDVTVISNIIAGTSAGALQSPAERVESVTIRLEITLTSQWARWRLKSPASRLFTQLFIQTQIKENTKAPCHWPLCGEFTGDRWVKMAKWPEIKGQWYSFSIPAQRIPRSIFGANLFAESSSNPLQVMTWTS